MRLDCYSVSGMSRLYLDSKEFGLFIALYYKYPLGFGDCPEHIFLDPLVLWMIPEKIFWITEKKVRNLGRFHLGNLSLYICNFQAQKCKSLKLKWCLINFANCDLQYTALCRSGEVRAAGTNRDMGTGPHQVLPGIDARPVLLKDLVPPEF